MMTIGCPGEHRHDLTPPRLLPQALPIAMALALGTLLPSRASAFDLEYDLGTHVSYSDNITLSQTDPEDDTVVAPTVRFQVSQAGADVQIDGRGLLQYTDYLDDTYADELRAEFTGGLYWEILPSRLTMVFQDYLSQQNVEYRTRSTPDNLQQVNFFVVGPSFNAQFNPATRGQFDLRYGNTYAEESEAFNGDRYSAAARIRREITATTEITGNLEAARIEYDPAGAAANYDRWDAYFAFKLRRPMLDLSLEIGHSELDLATGGNASSPLVRGEAALELSARSHLRADLRYQLTDATQYLVTPMLDQLEGRRYFDLNYPDISVNPDVFRERSVRTSYEYNNTRTSLRLMPYYRRIAYLNPPVAGPVNDQDIKGVTFEIEYRLRPLLALELYLAREERDYVDDSRNDKNTTIDIGLAKRFTRHWSGRVGAGYRKNTSSASGEGYEENVAVLSIEYRR